MDGRLFEIAVARELALKRFDVATEVEIGGKILDIVVRSPTTACVVELKWNVREISLSTLAFLAEARDKLGYQNPDIPVRSVLVAKMRADRAVSSGILHTADSLGLHVAVVKDHGEAADAIEDQLRSND